MHRTAWGCHVQESEGGDVTSEIRSRGSLMPATGSPSPLAGAPGSPPPAPRVDFNLSDTLLSITP